MRIRQLSDKLCQLQDELDTEKEVRGEAVELKLKVLDDKLIRAQVAVWLFLITPFLCFHN